MARRFKLSRILISLFAAWVLLVVLRIQLSQTDYQRVLHGKEPFYAFNTGTACGDGGTILYQGLGYRLVDLTEMVGNNDQLLGYHRGPKLYYTLNWLFMPFDDREDIHFEPCPSKPAESE